jgi:hypothetical protein
MHQFLAALQGLGAALGALVSIGVFVHLVIVRPLRHFLRNEVVQELVAIRTELAAHVGDHTHLGGWAAKRPL